MFNEQADVAPIVSFYPDTVAEFRARFTTGDDEEVLSRRHMRTLHPARVSTQPRRNVVDVAVTPRLARFGAPNQRVVERHVVLAGVSIGRRVAAADVAAVQAHPEMDPGVSRLQAFLAADDLVRQGRNLDTIVVFTSRHDFPLLSYEHKNRSLRRDNSLRAG